MNTTDFIKKAEMVETHDGLKLYVVATGDKKPTFWVHFKNGGASLFGGHLGDKVRQKSANKQYLNQKSAKPEQSLTLENKAFTGLFLQIFCVSLQSDYFPTHHRQSIEYQRSVNLIGTWLFFESFSKVSESASA